MKRTTAFIFLTVLIIILLMMSCGQKPSTQNAQPQQEESYVIGRVIDVRIIETDAEIYEKNHDAWTLKRTSKNLELQQGEEIRGHRSICEATILVNGDNYTSVYYDNKLRIREGDVLSIPEDAIQYDSKTIESAAIRSFARSK